MICDRRIEAIVKFKVYKITVRSAMVYGLEEKALTKKTEGRAEDFMLFTGSDQDRAQVEMFSKSVRGKAEMEEDHSED